MNLLDLVIVGLLLLGGLAGYRKGLINAAIGLAASFISFVIAFSTYKKLTPVVANLGLGKMVQGAVKSVMSLPAAQGQPIKGNGLDQLALLTKLLPKPMQNELDAMFIEMMKSSAGATIKNIGEAMIGYITLVVVSMISFFLIFFICNWLLRFLGKSLTGGIGKGLVGSINSFGGFLAGVAASLLSVSVLFGFSGPIFSFNHGPGLLQTFSQLAQTSFLIPYLRQVFTGITHWLSYSLN